MIERAGFWRRGVAAGVDMLLVLLLFQGTVALLSGLTGGHVATSLGVYTACRAAAELPEGVALPPDFGASRQALCTASFLGIPTRSLFVATREARAGSVLETAQYAVPVSPDGRSAMRVLSLDALFNPLFLLLRWATDTAWRASPGRRLVRIAVTDAGGTAAGPERQNLLTLRYARLAWVYLPGSLLIAAAACCEAATGGVPPLLAALTWFAGSVWIGAAQIAATMAIVRRRDTFYDAAVGTAVATRLEIARATDMRPDARVARGPSPVDDLRLALARVRIPWASCGLVAVMLAVFLGETAFGAAPPLPAGLHPETLAAWGGVDRELALLSWQPYRLLAAVFVHGNTTHLVVNALALLVVGSLLEPWLGRALFVAMFLACGVAGSLASISYNPQLMISVGASGAVLGLYAAALALAWRVPAGRARSWLLAWPIVVCLPALVPVVKLPDGLMVDVADHAGGEAAGLLLGIAVVLAWRGGILRRPSRRTTRTAGAIASVVLAVTVAIGGVRSPAQAVRLVPPGEAPPDDAGWIRRARDLADRYPEDPRPRYGLAVDEAEHGAAAQAVADMDAAIAMQRTLSPARADDFRFTAHAAVGAALFGAGDLDAAIVQYTAALAERPQASLYRQRGISEFYRGRGADAVADLRRALAADRKEAYAVLWLSIVADRTGLEDPIAATARTADVDAWPGQVIRFFDGTMRRDVMAAAAGALDLVSDQNRVCEATFYTAEWHLMRHEEDAARPLLEDAASTCPKTFIEHRAAREELAGRGGLPPG